MTTQLTERQQQAAAIARESHQLGAAVTCPLPLQAGKRLRFEVVDDQREAVLGKIADWGWPVAWRGASGRFSYDGLKPSTVYEITIEADRVPVWDRRIADDRTPRREPSEELKAYKKLGLS